MFTVIFLQQLLFVTVLETSSICKWAEPINRQERALFTNTQDQ